MNTKDQKINEIKLWINVESYAYFPLLTFLRMFKTLTFFMMQTMVSKTIAELTMTCLSNGNFKVFPYTNISKSRMNDICSVLCGFWWFNDHITWGNFVQILAVKYSLIVIANTIALPYLYILTFWFSSLDFPSL